MSTQQAVVIGRFQPFHNQHAVLLLRALSVSDGSVYVVVGGANKPRTPKDPFTFDERKQMIIAWAKAAGQDVNRLVIVPARDYMYSNTAWVEQVQRLVPSGCVTRLVGCSKDQSSFYLDMFPQWELDLLPYNERVDATLVRNLIYDQRSFSFISGAVPPTTLAFLEQFVQTDAYALVAHEHEVISTYKKAFETLPYPPTFVTVDALVVCNGHVLMVERKAAPGKGLLALPGGFLDTSEVVIDGIIRELREETKIKVPDPVLRGSLREIKVFDHPNRSQRGRTITHTGLIVLNDKRSLPKVKGSDDAKYASWIPLSDVDSATCFEDHFDQIEYFKSVM